MTHTRYVFADRQETPTGLHRELVGQLAAILDPFTTARLDQAGVRPGARCLEIGAGAGTIARWLADLVGPGGEVVATDLDPSHIPPHPRITARRHDIATDPLDRSGYDLIHARLVLGHLPQRQQVLRTLAAALVPGGVLVIEEFDASWNRCVMATADEEAYRLFITYHQALMSVLEAAGADPTWGRAAHQAMRTAGLTDVETEFWARSWHGGEPGCLLPYAAAEQLRPKLVAAGMPGADIDDFRALLLDPRLVIHGNVAVSTIGRQPLEPAGRPYAY